MAAINFVKGEQYYTAEFQINGPVNVHIERAEAGALYFRQRSIDHGSYDLINGANWNNRGDLTIDTAIQGVVYPMWIKIESASEPTLAEMVEGESSGGGAGTESTMEYLDVSGANVLVKASIVQYAVYVKGYIESYDAYMTGTPLFILEQMASNPIDSTSAIAIDFSNVVLMKMGDTIQNMTVAEVVLQNGATQAEIDSIPRITKEQFYNLEA